MESEGKKNPLKQFSSKKRDVEEVEIDIGSLIILLTNKCLKLETEINDINRRLEELENVNRK